MKMIWHKAIAKKMTKFQPFISYFF